MLDNSLFYEQRVKEVYCTNLHLKVELMAFLRHTTKAELSSQTFHRVGSNRACLLHRATYFQNVEEFDTLESANRLSAWFELTTRYRSLGKCTHTHTHSSFP